MLLQPLLWLLLLFSQNPCRAKLSQNLTEAVARAVTQQRNFQAANTTSTEVELAPAADLNAGTGDIATDGPCEEDIKIFCPNIKPGYAHVAECLNNQLFDERDGTSEFTVRVSKPCRSMLLRFKMSLTTNINLDLNMAADCKADAKKLCGYVKEYTFPGKVIACLREKKGDLSDKCKRRISRAQVDAADDYRLDASLYSACKADADTVCKAVEAGSGRVNACLRENRAQARPCFACSMHGPPAYSIAQLVGAQSALSGCQSLVHYAHSHLRFLLN